MHEKTHPFVSVIIPIFNDSDRLKTCLQALEDQTYPRQLYEVLVVDNGSDQSIEPIVALFGQARATYEDHPGSYAARNKGISLACGDVLAFTDSDCIPAPDWIQKGVGNLLQTPNCGWVAGRVDIFVQDIARPTPVELYEKIMAFPQEKYVKKFNFGATANLFTFKDVVEKVGGFNSKLKSGGDMEWGRWVFSAGYAIKYADDVSVAHPALRSLGQLYKKTVRVAGGFYDGRPKDQHSFFGFDKVLLKGLVPPVRSTARVLADRRLKGIKQKTQVILLEFFVRYVKVVERFRLNLGGKSRRV